MGPELCPRKWRQVAVSIGREFIPPHLHVGGGGNNTNDLVLAHSTPQSRSRYGLVCNDIPTLTNDAVCEYRDVCHAWWDVVGVGFATAPPEPLRMIRLGALSINTARLNNPSLPGNPFPDVQGIITSAINEALRDFKDELVKEILPSLVQQIASGPHLRQSSKTCHKIKYCSDLHTVGPIFLMISSPKTQKSVVRKLSYNTTHEYI